MSTQVLILSDDQEAARIWSHTLNHWQIEPVTRQYERLTDLVKTLSTYALIIVDDYHGACDVLALCRAVRAANPHPLLLFTYEAGERYHLEAYQIGVDESVAKPIGMRLCQQKVLAWLRRAMPSMNPVSPTVLEVAGFELDGQDRLLTLPNGKNMRLSRQEYRLMYVLMANHGQIVETEQLISRIWDDYVAAEKQMLKNLVYRLRQKIEPIPQCPRYIKTVSHTGYTFEVYLNGEGQKS